MFLVLCYYVSLPSELRDFRIKTIFGCSLLQVVFGRAHVLFTLSVFPCDHVGQVCCGFFSIVCQVLPVYLHCSFLIPPSVFSNLYLLHKTVVAEL